MIDQERDASVAIRAFAIRIGKVAAGCMLGVSSLGWMAAHSGPRFGTVVVHVIESDVEVDVGPISFPVPGHSEAPLVCELPAGRHSLTMLRGGGLLFREDFDVIAGEEVVLTAWVSPHTDRIDVTTGEPPGSDSLARPVGP